ncbi:hypothetical protein CMV_011787 [Castanea mollissima]|uniref:TIR domain-containing protein n=1 Tax=Castanea mollissima TaxID=60419 RepID=A0A8J4VNG9_9ROSI|nr:hypothetical protein CMV_011787 [Castanea mollissima]
MACSFASSLSVLALLLFLSLGSALVLPQLGLCVATMAHSVFVSFHGEDTRTSFTGHLFAALERKRIRAYRGEYIQTELMKAIETSRIAVVVFSKNYATSNWCLDELVKIMECKRLLNQRVLRIFYDVSPSKVRKEGENLAEAILNGPEDKVNIWKAALTKVSNLAGWHLKPYRPEPEFIEEIVEIIWKILYEESPTSTIPPCRQNDVPGQCSSLIIPQKGPLRGDNGHAWLEHLEAKEFKANPIGVLLWGLAFGNFLLNGSFKFWIHGLKVWICMSSGFWVLDSGWVVGLGLLGRIWATDFGFEVGLVIIGIRSG